MANAEKDQKDSQELVEDQAPAEEVVLGPGASGDPEAPAVAPQGSMPLPTTQGDPALDPAADPVIDGDAAEADPQGPVGEYPVVNDEGAQ